MINTVMTKWHRLFSNDVKANAAEKYWLGDTNGYIQSVVFNDSMVMSIYISDETIDWLWYIIFDDIDDMKLSLILWYLWLISGWEVKYCVLHSHWWWLSILCVLHLTDDDSFSDILSIDIHLLCYSHCESLFGWLLSLIQWLLTHCP
jgi:hypothetical protein